MDKQVTGKQFDLQMKMCKPYIIDVLNKGEEVRLKKSRDGEIVIHKSKYSKLN